MIPLRNAGKVGAIPLHNDAKTPNGVYVDMLLMQTGIDAASQELRTSYQIHYAAGVCVTDAKTGAEKWENTGSAGMIQIQNIKEPDPDLAAVAEEMGTLYARMVELAGKVYAVKGKV